MSTLYLHVGPHKTGSTYLQKIFKDQASQLKKQSVEYPEIGCEYSSAHHNIAWFFAERPPINTTRPRLEEDLSVLSQMKGYNLLLSSEEFSKLSSERLNDLKNTFSDWEFHTLYFLRRGSSFILSLWQEGIKHGSVTPLNQATLPYITKDFHYNPLAHDENTANFKQYLKGSVSVIDYSEMSEIKKDLIYPVSEIIKAKLKSVNKIVNPRLDQQTVELIRAANLHNAAIGKQRSGVPRIACFKTLKTPLWGRYLKWNLYAIFKKHHQLLSGSAFLDMGYQPSHLNINETSRDISYKYLPELTLLDELNKNNILPWRVIKKFVQEN